MTGRAEIYDAVHDCIAIAMRQPCSRVVSKVGDWNISVTPKQDMATLSEEYLISIVKAPVDEEMMP